MTSGKRLILFRRLGPAELRVAQILRRLGFEIRFLEPVGALRNPDAVSALNARGIVWLKASGLHGIDAFMPIAAGHRLAASIIDRCFPPKALSRLASVMPFPADDTSTLRILLYELVRGYVMPHGLAVTVARLLQGQGYRVWLWQQDAAMLPLARPGFRNLHSSLPSIVAKIVRRLRQRLFRSSIADQLHVPVNAPSASDIKAPVDKAEVLFFPHQGPYYGDLHEKDQYYVDDPKSPFHRSRICHVELAEGIAPEARAGVADAYRRAGLSVHWLPPTGRSRIAPTEFVRLAFRIGPVAALLGLTLRHRLLALRSQLSAFSRARVAVLGYDSLFPRVMAAALQARGIAVAAAQDRFVQSFHPGVHLILDHYLVHGERSASAIRARSLCQLGAVTVTGDLRLPSRPRVRRDGAHRCLVLDYHSAASPFDDAFAIGNSWDSNRLFVEDVLRLSEDFPDVHFTVRGKDTHWVALPAFADLVARIAARSNVTIDQDRSLDRSYALLSDSDSVVARHTSLGDQALSLGMPVLFHERMATGERSIAAVFDYSPYPLLTRSYDELRIKFAAILSRGHILEPEQLAQLRREFYAQPAGQEPRQAAARILESFLTKPPSPSYPDVVSLAS